MSTKITKGLAIIAFVGALAGGVAACGNSASTAPAPKPSASTTAPAQAPVKMDPTKAMAGWVAVGGIDALNSVGRDLSAMGDHPTQQQISALSEAIAKAESRPMPSSVDPKGAYTAMLEHVKKIITAYQNDDIATALSEVGAIGANMKTLQAEMKAAGFDVSSPSN